MLVTIAYHKSLLIKLCQVFHNNILVVKIMRLLMNLISVNQRILTIITNSFYDYDSFGFDHCQPPQYTVNHPIFNAHNDLLNANNDLLNSQNKITIAQNKLMDQLKSMCAMVGQFIQKKQEEKRIEEEQMAKAQNSKISVCYDDDEDYSAVTPSEPIDSLSMGDKHLDTIPTMELDKVIKSCVENLVPNPRESELLHNEDVLEEIFSNPLFEEEIISIKIDQHHFNVESNLVESMLNRDSSIISSSLKIDSLLDEFAGELTLLKSIPPGIDDTDCHPKNEILTPSWKKWIYPFIRMVQCRQALRMMMDSERDVLILEELPSNYSLSLPVNESFYFDIPSFFRPPAKPPDGDKEILNIKMMGDVSDQKVSIPNLTITLASNQEKCPDLLSHRGLEIFKPSTKCPMMIHGKNIPILDVPLFHFYPLDQLKYGGNWVKVSDLKQALRGRHPMLISS
uniref:Uncharacterized protein n=1 Tax=Tanacetum cinerariifolium TaxID=118510 RepID=A0A6L2JZK9_TANCI|nr:hypothetical protein [Tanacetum cinerariifolium]